MKGTAQEKPTKRCGCTGVRWCAFCADPEFRSHYKMDPPLELPAIAVDADPERDARVFAFDASTQTVPGLSTFSGLYVLHDFLSEAEEAELLNAIEQSPFVRAQSGKEKQHYGPKINFNKMRINPTPFQGLPAYLAPLEQRLLSEFDVAIRSAALGGKQAANARSAVADFETTDLFVLRYHAQQNSNLDFHIDDTFAYGEAIFGVSLESDAAMTFYRRDSITNARSTEACVLAPLPARCALVLTGDARFAWEHAILARDIVARRTSITLRTLSAGLRDSDAGRIVMDTAQRSRAQD